MIISQYIINVFILLLATVVVISIFRWIKISPILGYFIAGIIIGPHALGFINDIEGVKTIAEFGVVFLLFTIGLKMPLQRFKVLKRYVFGLGFLQVFITGTVFSLIINSYLSIPIEVSILIGFIFSLSSTAICLQVLYERKELSSQFGRISFSILLFQDLMVVALLVLLSSLTEKKYPIESIISIALFKTFSVIILIIFIGRILLRPIYKTIASFDYQELLVATSLLIILTIAVITEYSGLSRGLGAFLAGLLLSETEYRHQIEADIQPFKGLLIGLFFISIGMNINLDMIAKNLNVIPNIILIFIAIKSAIIILLCFIFRLPLYSSLRIGLLLAGGGEFAFVILAPAINEGLIHSNIGHWLYIVVAITMLITPILDAIGKILSKKILSYKPNKFLKTSIEEISDLKHHIIIGGFGRVGKLLSQLLAKQMIPFIVIEKDISKVTEGRSEGLPVFYGDVTRSSVLKTAKISHSKAIILSLNNSSATVKATMLIRREFPNIKVAVRLRDDKEESRLVKSGAFLVMPENLEPALQLASSALSELNLPSEEINRIINNFRNAYNPLI